MPITITPELEALLRSRAEAAVAHPLDPIELAEAVTRLLRSRVPAQT